MAVSKQFNALVLDLLGEVTAVSARRMFGGVGNYSRSPGALKEITFATARGAPARQLATAR